MSKFRRAAKVDANQPAIVDELRKRGYSVEVGHDDILVGRNGRTYWYEIKTDEKAAVKDTQIKLQENFKGHYAIVWTIEMILEDIKNA